MSVNRQHVKGGAVGFAGAIAIATPFLVGWEGFEPVARHDPIDPAGVITVCNGITNYDLPGLKPGMKFTKDECGKLLATHLPRYAAPIDKCVKVDISDHTRAALIQRRLQSRGWQRVCQS
jgi:lysozyme